MLVSPHSDPVSDPVFSFFSEVLRIGAPDYVPNESDVLRARAKSSGIAETRYLHVHRFFCRWLIEIEIPQIQYGPAFHTHVRRRGSVNLSCQGLSLLTLVLH